MQLSYSFQSPIGIAGALLDIANKDIVSRANGEADSKNMKYGMGVVKGDSPGKDVLVPTEDSEPADFEGVLMTGHIDEMDRAGLIDIEHRQTVGVLNYGKAWARIAPGTEPAYGDDLFLIVNGEFAGFFTNEAEGAIEIQGRFIGGIGSGDIAPVEIFNQKQGKKEEEIDG